jgi:hypothetical protein
LTPVGPAPKWKKLHSTIEGEMKKASIYFALLLVLVAGMSVFMHGCGKSDSTKFTVVGAAA